MKTMMTALILTVAAWAPAASAADWRIECNGENLALAVEGAAGAQSITVKNRDDVVARAGQWSAREIRRGIEFVSIAGANGTVEIYFDQPGSIEKMICARGGRISMMVRSPGWREIESVSCSARATPEILAKCR